MELESKGYSLKWLGLIEGCCIIVYPIYLIVSPFWDSVDTRPYWLFFVQTGPELVQTG